MLNTRVFENIKKSEKQILVVTKYWDIGKTQDVLSCVENNYSDIFYGLGENRIEQIQEKNIPREKMHFIGNIQSKKIGEIVNSCSVIHSLSTLKHAEKIERQSINIKCFIQIQLDEEKENGIPEDELGGFIESCKNFKYLKIIGISGMGSMKISEEEKIKEFQTLIQLRNLHMPDGLISAGTSVDYKVALQEGIDIVRVGQKSVK